MRLTTNKKEDELREEQQKRVVLNLKNDSN